ncbi:AraC family transcriptional regulator [Marinicrinis lubricantis]|uniref:AraC family transcriptional regulator n=1 Tax=Marinicrinis lubricantis TaxID=2086470 RepID=A0ABW1ISI5_9BACL
MPVSTYSVGVNPFPEEGELAVLFSGYESTACGHKVGPQVLSYGLVHIVYAGKGKFTCLGKTFELRPGDAFFIAPGNLVSYESDEKDPLEYRWAAFRGHAAAAILSRMGIHPEKPVVRNCPITPLWSIFKEMERVCKEGEPYCDMKAGGLFRMALAEFHSATADKKRATDVDQASLLVQKAVQWLNVQYARPVTVEELAEEMGYHRTYLSKVFSKQMGISPVQYLLKVRMEHAKRLLSQPLTVQEVASSVGFTDALYFSKKFKEWFGSPPTAFRSRE